MLFGLVLGLYPILGKFVSAGAAYLDACHVETETDLGPPRFYPHSEWAPIRPGASWRWIKPGSIRTRAVGAAI
jgi:hypothetical protein